MALIGTIITEKNQSVKLRPGEVVADITMDRDYLQIRTYAMGDTEREKGSKQNIQLSRNKARELIAHLEQFVNS